MAAGLEEVFLRGRRHTSSSLIRHMPADCPSITVMRPGLKLTLNWELTID